MKNRMRLALLTAALWIIATPMSRAQSSPLCVEEQGKMWATASVTSMSFGERMDISGDTAVISAPRKPSTGNGRGTAYVFDRSGSSWTQTQVLRSDRNDPAAFFGGGVAISGDTIVVGDGWDDFSGTTDAGAVFVYERTGTVWNQTDKLVHDNIVQFDHLGESVDIDGDRVIVGAPSKVVNGFAGSGAAYIFERVGTTWTQAANLSYNDPETFLHFGASVAISGDVAVVGADGDSAAGTSAGSAYLFRRINGNWINWQKLLGSDLGSNDSFGRSIDVSGTTVLVGNRDRGVAGAAYVFEDIGGPFWTEEMKLVPDDITLNGQFGQAVAIHGDRAVVGDHIDSFTFAGGGAPPTGIEGSVYVFERSGTVWNRMALTIAKDDEPQDQFGYAVALDGDTMLVGAWKDDDGATDAGTAYAHLLSRSEATYCTGKTSSLGCMPRVVTCGTPSASSPSPFRIYANDAIPGGAGLLLYSYGNANMDFHGGKLCIKAPFVTRFPPKTARTYGTPPCSGVLRRNFNRRIQSGVDPLLTMGQTVYAQWRQRDLNDPAGFGDSLSNAVTFTVQP